MTKAYALIAIVLGILLGGFSINELVLSETGLMIGKVSGCTPGDVARCEHGYKGCGKGGEWKSCLDTKRAHVNGLNGSVYRCAVNQGEECTLKGLEIGDYVVVKYNPSKIFNEQDGDKRYNLCGYSDLKEFGENGSTYGCVRNVDMEHLGHFKSTGFIRKKGEFVLFKILLFPSSVEVDGNNINEHLTIDEYVLDVDIG